MAVEKHLFDNVSLQIDHKLTILHSLNTTEIMAKWYDNNGFERSTAGLFEIVDANTINLYCNETITGTHTLLLFYTAAEEAGTGRRLFELTTTTNPATSMRLAMGKASTPSLNITLSYFITWLEGKLNFLSKSLNLSDLTSKSAARSNLAVYSSSQVDALVAQKATLFQAASGYAVGTENTSIYNPSTNYHPAMLRNVKNLGIQMLYSGYVSSDAGTLTTHFWNTDLLAVAPTVSLVSTGIYQLDHNLNSLAYFVIATPVGTLEVKNDGKVEKQLNYFKTMFTGGGGSASDSAFDFFMFKLNTYSADE